MATHLKRSLRISRDVLRAIEKCQAGNLSRSKIVLLESALITHGVPYPDNYKLALRLEEIVRNNGAIPATVGVINGQVHVGLDNDQIHHLADPSTPKVKVSRRDFSYTLGKEMTGGTTVSGTLSVANLGDSFPIFVTGGIGGVHRGGENSLDISADLMEMGRSRTMTVSAGVKSILDIGRTLEYLETQGVSVVTYGESKEFPCFMSKRSGFFAPTNVKNIPEACQMLRRHMDLGLRSGILLAVPIPDHAAEDGEYIERAIQEALAKAESQGIRGSGVTPFVLEEMNNVTKGKSLAANWALLENNADIGSKIAVALAEKKESNLHHAVNAKISSADQSPVSPTAKSGPNSNKHPCVIGGSNIDLISTVTDSGDLRMDGSTHNGKIHLRLGGVGRNLADALARLGTEPNFLSAVGDDDFGRIILENNDKLKKNNIKVVRGTHESTALYNLILNPDGEVYFGVGDTSIHDQIDPGYISSREEAILRSSMVAFDSNLSESAIDYILKTVHDTRIPTFFEPTDSVKCKRALTSSYFSSVTYASPNTSELFSLTGNTLQMSKSDTKNILHNCVDVCEDLLRSVQLVIITLSEQGVLIVRRGQATDPLPTSNDPKVHGAGTFVVSATHYPLAESEIRKSICVSGTGDCFAAAFIEGILRDCSQEEAVSAGLQAAALSLGSYCAVPAELSNQVINWSKPVKGVMIK